MLKRAEAATAEATEEAQDWWWGRVASKRAWDSLCFLSRSGQVTAVETGEILGRLEEEERIASLEALVRAQGERIIQLSYAIAELQADDIMLRCRETEEIEER